MTSDKERIRLANQNYLGEYCYLCGDEIEAGEEYIDPQTKDVDGEAVNICMGCGLRIGQLVEGKGT